MPSLLVRWAESLTEPRVDETASGDSTYQGPPEARGLADDAATRRLRFTKAVGFSIAAHAVVLAILAHLALYQQHRSPPVRLDCEFDAPVETPDLSYTMADPRDKPLPNVLQALSMATAPTIKNDVDLRTTSEVAELETSVEIRPPLVEIAGFELDNLIVQTGTVGEEVRQVEGAVDRLTHEILAHLQESKLLVVWLMDASISLVDDRREIADRLDRVYRELGQSGSTTDDALVSAVVTFGEGCQELAGPTTDTLAIARAIRAVPTDESGIENVFASVVASVQRYQHLRADEQRKLLFVIWTDESGNDYARVDDAVRMCRFSATPVYIVGTSAMFGKEKGTLSYKHSDGKTYRLPVDRGPDAVRQERLSLPYWFAGEQYDNMHSGLGPFALTRLAFETGGAYFIKDPAADRASFSPDVMRRYMPEYDSVGAYLKSARTNRLRQAVLDAVDLTYQRKLKGTPRLIFAPTGQTFYQELLEAQKSVAYNLLTIQQAINQFGQQGLEDAYRAEKSPRWRAWYDLTYGRLLAMSVRCNEYNWACALMKGKGADFVDQKSNRWQFRPSEETHFGSQIARHAKEAKRLLTRCVDQNPGTPWALLAQRELTQPFGFTVDEAYVAPPPPPPPRPAQPAAAPPPPPSNVRSTEQPNRLARPVQAPLPKL